MSLLSELTRCSRIAVATALGVGILITAPLAVAADRPAARQGLQITTLSTKPQLVSGGDVLVRIDAPANVSLQRIVVKLNGYDVSDDFRRDRDERALVGL